MGCKFKGCKNDVVAKGWCNMHYRYMRTKARESALKDVIKAIDELATKKPDLSPMLVDITKEAKNLFIEFKERKPRRVSKMDMLRDEIAELRKLVKSK